MNYTQAVANLNEANVEHHLSPRYQMCPYYEDQINIYNTEGTQLVDGGTMCLKWLDTDQEKAINVGVSWPYDKLEPYECLVSVEFAASAGVVSGDQIVISVGWSAFWMNLKN